MELSGSSTAPLLFVCTSNLHRSPTFEAVAKELGYSAISRGTDALELAPAAVRPLRGNQLTAPDIINATTIVCMEQGHAEVLVEILHAAGYDNVDTKIFVAIADVPDIYEYMDVDLAAIARRYLLRNVF